MTPGAVVAASPRFGRWTSLTPTGSPCSPPARSARTWAISGRRSCFRAASAAWHPCWQYVPWQSGHRRAAARTEAGYWVAIVVMRAAATNLADIITHDLAMNYVLASALLAVLTLIAARSTRPDPVRGWSPLVDSGGTGGDVVAGLFGTVAGDLFTIRLDCMLRLACSAWFSLALLSPAMSLHRLQCWSTGL